MELKDVVHLISYYKTIQKRINENQKKIREYETLCDSSCTHKSECYSNDVTISIQDIVIQHLFKLENISIQLIMEKIAIEEEFETLDHLHKQVLQFYYVDGCSWRKIARRLNYSESWCRQLRNNALEMLLKQINSSKKQSLFELLILKQQSVL